MQRKIVRAAIAGLAVTVSSLSVNAAIIRVAEGDFLAGAGLITFSEFAVNTVNPTYSAGDYGGEGGDPTVTFDGWFQGQSLSASPGVDCPGAAASACIVGSPSGPLALDPNSPDTFITIDGSNPSSPVLSGTPTFNGGIAILFSTDQFGVGFDGGFFNAISSTAITAFGRDGSLLGSVDNTVIGIEFLGLVSDDVGIAGVFLDLVGAEPAGFAIDNIRFGVRGEIDIGDGNDVPEPASLVLLGLGLAGLRFSRRKK
jgi:hypothetical protein